MRMRRFEAGRFLQEDEILSTVSSFPRLGCPSFTWPELWPDRSYGRLRSVFVPDAVVYGGHPRFAAITENIRRRRGEPVNVRVEPFLDSKTANSDHVYMDATVFGMGCCCLEVTVQTSCMQDACFLHDQLIPLAPVFLALTAASPVFRGYLADVDSRWDVASASVDCRTRHECNPWQQPEPSCVLVSNKSRCASPSLYLSPQYDTLNDLKVTCDPAVFERLWYAGVERSMARHVAHLFSRDPICLFREQMDTPRDPDTDTDTDLFEGVQSTNWQTVRFKPPPSLHSSDVGWRVEFRTCEAQFTDSENAAFACFIYLLSQTILKYRLEFVTPISLVDGNMKAAQKRAAVLNQQFFFRQWREDPGDAARPAYGPMTVDEIVNGRPGAFPGLVPLVRRYLAEGPEVMDADAERAVERHLRLVSGRASGTVETTATWIRRFIRRHPEYRHDSVVTDRINFDLLATAEQVHAGRVRCCKRDWNGDCDGGSERGASHEHDDAGPEHDTDPYYDDPDEHVVHRHVHFHHHHHIVRRQPPHRSDQRDNERAATSGGDDDDQPPPLPPPPPPHVRRKIMKNTGHRYNF